MATVGVKGLKDTECHRKPHGPIDDIRFSIVIYCKFETLPSYRDFAQNRYISYTLLYNPHLQIIS